MPTISFQDDKIVEANAVHILTLYFKRLLSFVQDSFVLLL